MLTRNHTVLPDTHTFVHKWNEPCLTLTASRRASPHFGWYSFSHPTEGRRRSWPVWHRFLWAGCASSQSSIGVRETKATWSTDPSNYHPLFNHQQTSEGKSVAAFISAFWLMPVWVLKRHVFPSCSCFVDSVLDVLYDCEQVSKSTASLDFIAWFLCAKLRLF